MSSWPPAIVDWGELTPRLRAGDPVCVVHGHVEPEPAPIGIPICPRCRQAVVLVDRDQQGLLRGFSEPPPGTVRGRGEAPLIDGRVLLGWNPCGCANAVPGPGRPSDLALPGVCRPGPGTRGRPAAVAAPHAAEQDAARRGR